MKAVIGGLRYNTDKADLVHCINVDKILQELYKTDNDRWFLHMPVLNTIQPMTTKEAQNYLENLGQVSLVETYFHSTIRDA